MNSYRLPTSGDMGTVLAGNAQGRLSISAVAAQTSAITSGGYFDIWSDVDAYIKVGVDASDVTTSTGYIVRAGITVPNIVINTGDKLGAIAGSNGTLSYHKVS